MFPTNASEVIGMCEVPGSVALAPYTIGLVLFTGSLAIVLYALALCLKLTHLFAVLLCPVSINTIVRCCKGHRASQNSFGETYKNEFNFEVEDPDLQDLEDTEALITAHEKSKSSNLSSTRAATTLNLDTDQTVGENSPLLLSGRA